MTNWLTEVSVDVAIPGRILPQVRLY